MIRKIASVSLCLLLAVTLVSCLEEEEKKSNTGAAERAAIENSMIDIPSSLSSASGASSSVSLSIKASADQDQIVEDVYNGVRGTIAGVENLITIAKTVVLWSTVLFAAADSGDWTNDDPAADEADRLIWGSSDDAGYERMIRFYYGESVGLKVYLTVSQETGTAKGIIDWDGSVVRDADSTNDTTRTRIVFDGTQASKTMEVAVTGMNGSDNTKAKNALVSVSTDVDGSVYLDGNYYIPEVKLIETSATTEERNYSFNAIGYTDEAIDPTLANKGMIQLAIPPSNIATVTMTYFFDYSVGKIYLDIITQALKTEWIAGAITVSDIETWTGNAVDIASSTVADMTSSEVKSVLVWAANNSADPDATSLQNMLFVLNLVNYAYFNGDEFIGTYNESSNTGTLTGIPAGFNDILPSQVTQYSPKAVKDLVLPPLN